MVSVMKRLWAYRRSNRLGFIGAVRVLVATLALGQAHAVVAGGLASLESFLSNTRSGRASFTQIVTPPARDGQISRGRTSTGVFEFQRPSRFRFVYAKPFEQTIVADGQTLWHFDADLNQVTARKQSDVLAATPVALVASASDLRSLQRDFVLQDAPDQDGLQWVLASPRSAEGTLKSVRIGLKPGERGASLAVLDMIDSFGQRSVLTLNGFEINANLAAGTFQFRPPPGADVIRP